MMRKHLPPSRFERTVTDVLTNSLTLISATSEGIRLGPQTANDAKIHAYRGGVNIFTEKAIAYVPSDDKPVLATDGAPLRLCCESLEVLTLAKPAILSSGGVNGRPGTKDGGTGGPLKLYIESLDRALATQLHLDAAGGRGQDLGPETAEASGNGGNGGPITVVFRPSEFSDAISLLKPLIDQLGLPKTWTEEDKTQASTLSDSDRALVQVGTIVKGIQERYTSSRAIVSEALAPLIKLIELSIPLGQEPKDDENFTVRSKYTLAGAIRRSMINLRKAADDTRVVLQRNCDNRGGRAGERLDMGHSPGSRGVDGSPAAILVSALAPSGMDVPFVFAHPLQCSMLLDKAKVYYYLGSTAHVQQAGKILEGLIDRLFFARDLMTAFDSGDMSQPLAKAYLDFFGSVEAARRAASKLYEIRTSAANVNVQLKIGKVDYYGHPVNWTPRTNYESLTQMLEKALTDLEQTEEIYLAYAAAKEKKEVADAKATLISNQVSASIDQVGQELKELMPLIAKKYHVLADETAKHNIIQAQKRADAAIKSLQGKVASHFELSPKSLMSSLVNVASFPSKALVAAQGGALVYEGFTTVPNISGDAISKDLLVRQLKQSSGSVSALKKEMLEIQSSGDGGEAVFPEFASKLLTTIAQVEALIDEFADNTFEGSSEVKDSLKAYSKLLFARNDEMVAYNFMLKKAVELQDKVAELEQSLKQLQIDKFEGQPHTSEALSGMTQLLESLYEYRRSGVMRLLKFLQSALRYKTLAEIDRVDQLWKEQAYEQPKTQEAALSMTSQTLRGIKEKLADRLFEIQELNSADISLFPSNFEGKGIGKLYHLSADQLKTLCEFGAVEFQIPTVDDNPDQPQVYSSEFRGCADVRIYRVRFWLHGIKIKGAKGLSTESTQRKGHADKAFGDSELITSVIKHSGNETFVSPDNRKVNFEHEPIRVTFSYRLYKDGSYGIEDASSGDVVNYSSKMRGVNSVYSAPSPYTTWTVSLMNVRQKELDWSDVSAAVLEFYGSYRSFLIS